MTLENCKLLLDHYKKCIDDSSLTTQARLNAKVAYADMKRNLDARTGGSKTIISDVKTKK